MIRAMDMRNVSEYVVAARTAAAQSYVAAMSTPELKALERDIETMRRIVSLELQKEARK